MSEVSRAFLPPVAESARQFAVEVDRTKPLDVTCRFCFCTIHASVILDHMQSQHPVELESLIAETHGESV